MSRFEEYGLYAENMSFLASGEIITFTDTNGKLMALRPDVTLSIVKNSRNGDGLKKLCYNENVYRPGAGGYEFKERMQAGLECIGALDTYAIGEVIMLAARSLSLFGGRSCLDISHMGYINALLQSAKTPITPDLRARILQCVSDKNSPELTALCIEHGLDDAFRDKITALTALYGPIDETLPRLRELCAGAQCDDALQELEDIFGVLQTLGVTENVNLDFSIVNDMRYYGGVIFQGYIEGVPSKVLSGGRYDELLRKFGKNDGAIGFAVYLDLLEQPLDDPDMSPPHDTDGIINVALPKGRLGDAAYEIFERAGYGCPGIYEDNRRLVFESPDGGVRYFWVKPSDVAIYVERGAADIGVAGKDILLEYSPEVYELLDLGIGRCRMAVAAKKGFTLSHDDRTLRVATKFVNIARRFFAKKGREIDVIKLGGSIELAPLLGLSDVIVDVVETGRTLLENGLEPVETIFDISARLIANKAGYKFNFDAITALCEKIQKELGA